MALEPCIIPTMILPGMDRILSEQREMIGRIAIEYVRLESCQRWRYRQTADAMEGSGAVAVADRFEHFYDTD